MKQLILGRMTNKDLADWFGVSAKTFTNTKKRKMEELKFFAEFYEEKGKVVITSIINDTYSKQSSENFLKVVNKVDEVWSDDGLDSCSRVSGEIYNILSEEGGDNFSLKPSSVYTYTLKGRNQLYGKPFVGNGSLGHCSYIWCKKNNKTGKYDMLSEEEQKIKHELQIKYFGDATEKQVLVKAMIEAGEITKAEAWDILEDMTHMNTGNFMGFLKELQSKLGCQVVKGTLVERSAFHAIEDKEFDFDEN